MELLLIGNAGEDSVRTGDWGFQATEFAGINELEIEPEIWMPMETASFIIGLLRGTASEAEITARREASAYSQDVDFASSSHDAIGWAAFADARFEDAAASWLQVATMSVLNAPYCLPRAAHAALLAGDVETANVVLERLIATGSHGRALDIDRQSIRAGIAALEGRTSEAIAGYRAAVAGWRELGLPWDEALTEVVAARVLGTGDPEIAAIADAARDILSSLGAVRMLAILDAAIAGAAGPAPETAAAG